MNKQQKKHYYNHIQRGNAFSDIILFIILYILYFLEANDVLIKENHERRLSFTLLLGFYSLLLLLLLLEKQELKTCDMTAKSSLFCFHGGIPTRHEYLGWTSASTSPPPGLRLSLKRVSFLCDAPSSHYHHPLAFFVPLTLIFSALTQHRLSSAAGEPASSFQGGTGEVEGAEVESSPTY